MSVVQHKYEVLRRHGLGHEAALKAAGESGPPRCWCGRENPCQSGAFRHVGCPIDLGDGQPHRRHRGDVPFDRSHA